jgi:hypothetical protein
MRVVGATVSMRISVVVGPHLLGVRQFLQQLCYRLAQDRMEILRRELRQRHQHKSSPVQLRMRNLQVHIIYNPVVIQQDIEIDLARAVALALAAPQRALDLLAYSKKLPRR